MVSATGEIGGEVLRQVIQLTKTYAPPVGTEILLADPKLELRYTAQLEKVSGFCRWVGWRYIITVNRREPVARQRFTVFHELKHAIDGAWMTQAINRFGDVGKRPAAEYVADRFASCVLMPEPWLVDALQGEPTIAELAHAFGVSMRAMRVRLRTLGHKGGTAGARP